MRKNLYLKMTSIAQISHLMRIETPKLMKQAKKVKFAEVPKMFPTFSKEDYDRNSNEIAVLKYKDILELMTIKLELRQMYEKEYALVSTNMDESKYTQSLKKQIALN